MKKKISSILSLLLIPILGFSQTEINLNDLEMPSSPAFILLDVAPTSIERPTTTKAFSTSVLNSISENNGIPENFALEFAPYWFFKHKKLNALNYWGVKKTTDGIKRKAFSQARFGNISFATVKTSSSIDSIGTLKQFSNMSLGFRTSLIQVRAKKDNEELIRLNQIHIERISAINNDPNLSPDEIFDLLENDEILTPNAEKIKDLLKRKPVFAVDLAGAAAWSFMDNNYNSIDINRLGVWMTVNYSQSLNKKGKSSLDDYLNFYLVGRFMQDNNIYNSDGLLISSYVFDSGGKIEFELDRLSFSYEYLFRQNFSGDNSNTFRSSGLFKYRASNNLLVTGAFGRNFGEENNLITQIGITWGLNSKNQGISF